MASFSGYFAPHPGPGSSRLTSVWEPIPEAITLTKGMEGAPWTRLDHMLIAEPVTVAKGICSLIKLGWRSCWFPQRDVHLLRAGLLFLLFLVRLNMFSVFIGSLVVSSFHELHLQVSLC